METSRKKANAVRAILALCGILLLMAAGWLLIGKNIFGVKTADRCVYGAGLLVAAFVWCLFAFFGLERLLEGIRELSKPQYFRSHVRTALFACISLLGMYYFNSGSNHGHRVATRLSLVCFALILATYFVKKELFCKRSLVYTLLCAAAFVCFALLGLIREDRHVEFVLNFGVAVCFGILFLAFARRLWGSPAGKAKEETGYRRLSKSYMALLLGFFVLILLFRNTRGWPFTVAVPFTFLYLLGLSETEWQKLLREFLNGVLWSFGVILTFSLLFRPYQKYFCPRYPLAFYSVATCSLYLAVVFLAAFWRLLECFALRKKGKELFFPLLVIGTVFCYTVMTVSRTAFLAIGAGAAVSVLCMACSQFKGRLTVLLCACGTAVVSALVLFPVIFTATRSIPAFVGHPYIMGGEFWEGETITSEDPVDSEKYMDIERFRTLTVDKLFRSFAGEGEADSGVSLQLEAVIRPGFKTASISPVLLVAHGVTPDTWYNESEGSASNGRVEIFLAYLERLNLTGHEAMGVDTEEMSYAHAHNTFLQTAYDHGLVTGIYFLILGAVSVIRAILYCVRKKNDMYAAIPVMMITAFGMASLTEWTFHPSILLGFTLLLVQGPLLWRLPEKERIAEGADS